MMHRSNAAYLIPVLALVFGAFGRSLFFAAAAATAADETNAGSTGSSDLKDQYHRRYKDPNLRGSTNLLGCDDSKTIPFMVTNADGVSSDDSEGNWLVIDEDTPRSNTSLSFLTDVVYCPEDEDSKWTITGKEISPNHFKDVVGLFLDEAENVSEILYYVHGFNNKANEIFMQAHDFNQEHIFSTGYLLVPIHWTCVSMQGLTSIIDMEKGYLTDRNSNAIAAGKLLAQNVDAFAVSDEYPVSLITHSMGNWVLRNIAQNVPEMSSPIFKNIFMVAADDRSDLFSAAFNPMATRTEAEEENVLSRLLISRNEEANDFSLTEEDFMPNGGYAITKLAQDIHVIWNQNDGKLYLAEKVGLMSGIQSVTVEYARRIGRYGDTLVYSNNTLAYFKERVTYTNITSQISGNNQHGYQFNEETIAVYLEYK